MRLFTKRESTVVPANVLGVLGMYGQAVLDARRAGLAVTDPRFDWANFVGPVRTALMGPNRDRVIEELYEAAVTAPDRDLATLGAYRLLAECDESLDDRRFLKLYDASLDYMRSLGFSSGHLTGHEARRWVEVHGELRSSFDGVFDVAVPSAPDVPSVKTLDPGEARMVALTAPLPQGNAFFAECRADGSYGVFSERQRSAEDPTRVRCEETHIGAFTSLHDLLRAVGAMLGTPSFWADEDLEPYFPNRRA
jgi:hypothetical protein